jgi:Uma2 family endonuclease
MAAKAGMWIDAGVRLVWVVWPTPRQVDVFAPEGEGTGRVLEAADRLNGEPVLPGFTYPVADLFV